MRITTQGDYGLVCVLRIAQQSDRQPVSIQRISEEEQLSVDYIEQLLLKLRRAGILKSSRGRLGGYILAKSTARISVKDVIQAVEGDVFETVCGRIERRGHKCAIKQECLAKPVWINLKRKIENYLNSVTLKDLLNSNSRSNEARTYGMTKRSEHKFVG